MLFSYGFVTTLAHSTLAAGQIAASSHFPITYVAIGASDSVGVGATDPATDSWPAVFSAKLPPGSRFINLGVPGITLHRALQVELPVALDALTSDEPCDGKSSSGRGCGQGRPVVTIWLAVNDLVTGVPLAHYAADLQTLLHTLHTRTSALVLVGNVPDLTLLPAASSFDRATVLAHVTAWNAVIAAAVSRNGAHLVDLYSKWRQLADHPEYVSSDGFHPSTAGYRQLALLFEDALLR